MNVTTFGSVDYVLLPHIYINKSFSSHVVKGAVLKKGRMDIRLVSHAVGQTF